MASVFGTPMIPVVAQASVRSIVDGDFVFDPSNTILLRVSGGFRFPTTVVERDQGYGFVQCVHLNASKSAIESNRTVDAVVGLLAMTYSEKYNMLVQTYETGITAAIIKAARYARMASSGSYDKPDPALLKILLDAIDSSALNSHHS